MTFTVMYLSLACSPHASETKKHCSLWRDSYKTVDDDCNCFSKPLVTGMAVFIINVSRIITWWRLQMDIRLRPLIIGPDRDYLTGKCKGVFNLSFCITHINCWNGVSFLIPFSGKCRVITTQAAESSNTE